MTEVEKLYRLANIAKPVIKKWYYDGYYEDFSWKSEEEDCTKLLKYFDNSIDKLNDRIQQMKKEENANYDRHTDSVMTEFGRVEKAYIDYPPFTAEKQIELIKWLSPRYLDLSKYHDVATDKDMYGIRTDVGTYAYCHREKFEEMIAGLIIDLWQDLTEAEQNEIREILE